jgi:large subunit ribosomal protein L23Ae
VHFRRPKTLRVRRKPKFPKRAAYPIKFQNDYDILRCPVNTEAAMRKVENLNTLVFVVDAKATKPMIKKAFERLYNVKCRKVNTLITFAPFSFLNLILSLIIVLIFWFSFDHCLVPFRPLGEKKAFIRLLPEYEALDTANKIGMV